MIQINKHKFEQQINRYMQNFETEKNQINQKSEFDKISIIEKYEIQIKEYLKEKEEMESNHEYQLNKYGDEINDHEENMKRGEEEIIKMKSNNDNLQKDIHNYEFNINKQRDIMSNEIQSLKIKLENIGQEVTMDETPELNIKIQNLQEKLLSSNLTEVELTQEKNYAIQQLKKSTNELKNLEIKTNMRFEKMINYNKKQMILKEESLQNVRRNMENMNDSYNNFRNEKFNSETHLNNENIKLKDKMQDLESNFQFEFNQKNRKIDDLDEILEEQKQAIKKHEHESERMQNKIILLDKDFQKKFIFSRANKR